MKCSPLQAVGYEKQRGGSVTKQENADAQLRRIACRMQQAIINQLIVQRLFKWGENLRLKYGRFATSRFHTA